MESLIRQTDFEKQVSDKRNEFESSINLKKPQPVDFSDKVEPEMKIMEMEALIAETMAKRKFDIEQIQGTNPVTNANTNTVTKPEKSVSFNDNVTLHVDDYESINLTETSKAEKEQAKAEELSTETSNIQHSIFNKLKETTTVPNKGITQLHDIMEYKTQTDAKLNDLNNKIDTLLIMMEKTLFLLEKNKY